MKTLLTSVALLLICAMSMVSCKKPFVDEQKQNLLTNKNGWTIDSAISRTADGKPGYQLSTENRITNLFQGCFSPCDMDDTLYFFTDGREYVDYGRILYNPNSPANRTLGDYQMDYENDILTFFPPQSKYYELTAPVDATVVQLSDNRLILEMEMQYPSSTDRYPVKLYYSTK